MATFSKRNGYRKDIIQLEYASKTLRKRIFARFYKQEFDVTFTGEWENYTTGIEDVMIEMGLTYEYPQNSVIKHDNVKKLEKYVVDSTEWYVIYDFVEKYLRLCSESIADLMQREFNYIMEDEMAPYRIVDRLVVPITNEMEIDTISAASETEYDTVNNHISKALSLFANRKKPDYENSIKESISAVESICCIITGQTGGNATLGRTIKKLKDYGIHIHPGMEKAFVSLYGFASDEEGIRHGGTESINTPSEDAKYMLVSCSAFVNYLIEKWSKVTSLDS